MEEEKRFKYQAEELSSIMDQINHDSDQLHQDDAVTEYPTDSASRDIDLLNLPPRSKTHASKKQKANLKWKIRYPLVRLLFILFILIVVLVLTFNKWWGKELLDSPGLLHANEHPAGEMVQINSIVSDFHQFETTIAQKELPENNIKSKDNGMRENTTVKKEQHFSYTVKENDTLLSIAIEFYGSPGGKNTIIEANQLSTSQIDVGQQLLLPHLPESK